MKHASFIESPDLEKGERPVFDATIGEHFDSVFIQVGYATYIKPQFQEWVKTSVMSRLTPDCDAIRVAVLSKTLN
jgi:hypothetical protein